MTWCVELVIALGVAAPVDVPAPVAALVRGAIGRSWRVDPAQVRLEWGRIATREPLADSARVRILGQGKDGRFVVALLTRAGGETAVSLRAGVADSVWVAGHSIAAGTRLAADDLRRVVQVIWGPPRAAAGSAPPLGSEARRNLAEGERLEAPAIEEAPVILPGDRIRFVWEQDGLRIVREAVAGSRARRGERVTGRDPVRQEQVSGIAMGPGTARLERKDVPE